MAKHADKFALVRIVYHTRRAVHDTGHQMMQTGRLFPAASSTRTSAACSATLKGPKGDVPPHVLLPRPIGNTGGNMPHGQTAGYLGKTHDPFVLNADPSDPTSQVPDLLPPDDISRDARRPPPQPARAGRRRGQELRSEPPTRGCSIASSSRPTR